MSSIKSLFVLVFLVGSAGGMTLCDEDDSSCLILFKGSLNFKDAQNRCVQEGGHLMTMRSNRLSPQMASLLLLTNSNGEFWIGLHRLGDCPDPEKKLRGFQWVTNDEETNYTNWSPSFDSSCSSPSCVHVSTRNSLQWVQAPCDGKATGFVCARGNSCPELEAEQAKGETIRYSQPNGSKYSVDRDKHISLQLPPGFTATLETSRIKYLCVSKQWVQAPWNCEIQEGGCEYKCMMNPEKSPICYCPPGQTVNPVNKRSCEAQPTGDPCQAMGCQHICYKKGDSYACACPQGFQIAIDGVSCLDIDECVDPRQCPVEGTMCINTLGGFKCVCKPGFKKTGDACMDVDECALGPCEHICVNVVGSYVCLCSDGHRVSPKSPDKCDIYCNKEECPAKCDPNNMFQCFCPDGFLLEERGTSMICVDIDECQSFSCDQDCKNTYGSYECSCYPGFTLTKRGGCKEDDEENGTEGSGLITPISDATSPFVPFPDPTRSPSGVTPGGLGGIIVVTTLLILLVLVGSHMLLSRKKKMESSGALKAAEGDAHGLERVTSDMDKCQTSC